MFVLLYWSGIAHELVLCRTTSTIDRLYFDKQSNDHCISGPTINEKQTTWRTGLICSKHSVVDCLLGLMDSALKVNTLGKHETRDASSEQCKHKTTSTMSIKVIRYLLWGCPKSTDTHTHARKNVHTRTHERTHTHTNVQKRYYTAQ